MDNEHGSNITKRYLIPLFPFMINKSKGRVKILLKKSPVGGKNI